MSAHGPMPKSAWIFPALAVLLFAAATGAGYGFTPSAGGLVFAGQGNGRFRAYDARNGSVLWTFNAGAGVNAPPSSYTAGGKQYIVVAAGGNVQLDYKRGNNIIAFTVE